MAGGTDPIAAAYAAYADPEELNKQRDEILHSVGLHPAQQSAQELLWQHAQARGAGAGGVPAEAHGMPGPAPPTPLPAVTPPPSPPPTPSSAAGDTTTPALTTRPPMSETPPVPLAGPLAGTGAAAGVPPALRGGTPVDPAIIKATQGALGQNLAEEQRLLRTGAGVSQIRNPFLRGLARVGDVAGTIMFPRAMEAIPGTTLHHEQLVSGAFERGKEYTSELQKEEQAQRESQLAAGAGSPWRLDVQAVGPNGRPMIVNQADPTQSFEAPEGVKISPPKQKPGDIPMSEAQQASEQQSHNAALAAFGIDSTPYQMVPDTSPNEAKQRFEEIKTVIKEKGGKAGTDFMQFYNQGVKDGRYTADSKGMLNAMRDRSAAQVKPPTVYAPNTATGGYTPEQAAFGKELAPGTVTGAGINPPGSLKTAAGRANTALYSIDDMRAFVDGHRDLIGPAAGRWNDFLQGKIGIDDPDFAELNTLYRLVSSGVTLAHSVGRMPVVLLEQFDSLLKPAQSPDNMIRILDTMRTTMTRMRDQGWGMLAPAPEEAPKLPSEQKKGAAGTEGVTRYYIAQENGKEIRKSFSPGNPNLMPFLKAHPEAREWNPK